LDLKLSSYRILATGTKDGALQFIPNQTLAHVLTEYHGILPYLRQHNPDGESNNHLGVKPEAMDTFVRSCAGYCVITYILGVGDRHLDNLLICPDGHFFHADYGYILGRDPKPFPPMMKLPIQIIEGMGGASSENYENFLKYCFTAYTTLRKSANLILNLFALMTQSSIPDIMFERDKAVLKVKEKFCLEMSEEEAMAHFQNLINDSVNAFLPMVIDRLHNFAQYWRS
jgi:phosphatidylinositol 3-kinase